MEGMQKDDSWMPSASLDILRKKAQFISSVRFFFSKKGYLEVETPIMAQFGVTDPYLENIVALFRGQGFALQTSPEYHMKRLLAAGSGPIFQLARVFRDDELGRWHNPEFTLLEWYKLSADHYTLLNEVDELLQSVANFAPIYKKTYRDAFLDSCDLDPFQTTIHELQCCLQRYGLDNVLDPDEQDIDQYLFLLMSHVVEPALAHDPHPTAIVDFPVSQASLAQIINGYAARFEVYYRGVELANGFYELTDAKAQAARFDRDNQIRRAQAKQPAQPDPYLLSALEHGLPACSGVALGMDRLFALTCQQTQLSRCLAFDFSRA